jgi:hypothetical protein
MDHLLAVRADLRREVGPTGKGSGNWQPMVAASEIWVLLDALDAVAPVPAVPAEPTPTPEQDEAWQRGYDLIQDEDVHAALDVLAPGDDDTTPGEIRARHPAPPAETREAAARITEVIGSTMALRKSPREIADAVLAALAPAPPTEGETP